MYIMIIHIHKSIQPKQKLSPSIYYVPGNDLGIKVSVVKAIMVSAFQGFRCEREKGNLLSCLMIILKENFSDVIYLCGIYIEI